MKYDAFISYSHAADGDLAPALQQGLHRLGRKWLALRALRVFRDRTNLAVNPELWPSIEGALAQSRHFILMASPAAGRSKWVARELEWWLAHRDVRQLLIVRTAGGLVWDDARSDFDWSRTDVLPPALAGRFAHEPQFADLAWVRQGQALSLDHPQFRAAVLDIAAPIHGIDKDLLDGEDVRQHARARRFTRAAVAGLSVLTVSSLVGAWIAVDQRRIAEDERAAAVAQGRIALSRQLAAQSALVLRQNPDRLALATLLALESLDRHRSFEASDALRGALTLLPEVEWRSTIAGVAGRGRVRALAFSPDGRLLATGREDGTAEVAEPAARRTVAVLAHDDAPGVATISPGGGIAWKAPGVDAEVVALAFSADNRHIATAGRDGTARVWTTDAGREIVRFVHEGPLASVAFHPSGAWLAAGTERGVLQVWRVHDQAPAWRIEAGEAVRAVRFSAEGRHLAAIDAGGCLHVVVMPESAAADPVAGARRHCAGTSGADLVFSGDGRFVATANGDRALVYGVEDGRITFRATHQASVDDGNPDHFRWIDQVALDQRGTVLATAGRDGTARVWDLKLAQEMVRLPHQAPVAAVALDADARRALTASVDGTARLWELPSGREMLRAVSPGGIEAVAFSPDGRQAASAGNGAAVEVWGLRKGDQVFAERHPTSVEAIAFTSNAERIATVHRDGALRLWSDRGERIADRPGFHGVRTMAFSASGRYLVMHGRAPNLAMLDVRNDLASIDIPGARDADDVRPGTRIVAARHRRTGTLLAWESEGGAQVMVPDGEGRIDELRQTPDSRHLATLATDSTGNGEIRVRTLPDLRVIGRAPFARRGPWAISPAGDVLAMHVGERDAPQGDWRWRLDLVEVVSGTHRARIDLPHAFRWIGFDPAGQRLHGIGDDGTGHERDLVVWDAIDGRMLGVLRHEGEIDRVVFAQSGDVVATRSGEHVRLWDVRTYEPLTQASAASHFTVFGLSPDGARLLTGSGEGEVASWLWRHDDLRAEACRRVGRNLTEDEWRRYLGDEVFRATCVVGAEAGVAGRR